MKGELVASIHVALEDAPDIFLQGGLKTTQKYEEKDKFGVAIDGLLDSEIEGSHEGEPKDALNDLHKDAQEVTLTFQSKQNVVNIFPFRLFLIMFNVSTKQAISRGPLG